MPTKKRSPVFELPERKWDLSATDLTEQGFDPDSIEAHASCEWWEVLARTEAAIEAAGLVGADAQAILKAIADRHRSIWGSYSGV